MLCSIYSWSNTYVHCPHYTKSARYQNLKFLPKTPTSKELFDYAFTLEDIVKTTNSPELIVKTSQVYCKTRQMTINCVVIDSLHTGLNYSNPMHKPKSCTSFPCESAKTWAQVTLLYHRTGLDQHSQVILLCQKTGIWSVFVSYLFLPKYWNWSTFAIFTGSQHTKYCLFQFTWSHPEFYCCT